MVSRRNRRDERALISEFNLPRWGKFNAGPKRFPGQALAQHYFLSVFSTFLTGALSVLVSLGLLESEADPEVDLFL